jgi:hypothetical protein
MSCRRRKNISGKPPKHDSKMTTSLVLTGGNFAANSRTAWTYTTGTITATHTAQIAASRQRRHRRF